jgi:hypothetical protein
MVSRWLKSMSNSDKPKILVRPLQYRDLADIQLAGVEETDADGHQQLAQTLQQIDRWHGALAFGASGALELIRSIPQPYHYRHCLLVAEIDQQIQGIIQVAPFNRTRSTWQVQYVLVNRQIKVKNDPDTLPDPTVLTAMDCGSQLLRYCFEKIVEASNWLLEVDVNDQAALGLYRQNGFQPLAQLTYWEIAPEILQELGANVPDLPNLLPVRNNDAQLLYQLDTVAMPPLLRQVFDRQSHDFKVGIMQKVSQGVRTYFGHCREASQYVFESQRKAAIGYYRLNLSLEAEAHTAELTVHPAYTWLYPELMAQMAQVCQASQPQKALELVSADYQPEREEYLQRIGATRTKHSLLMSRSVWHKVREAKHISLEGLQLADVLSGLQPVRNPIPSRWEIARSQERLGIATNVGED